MALRLYEDGMCPGCGQQIRYAMNPDLAEYWTTMAPVRDHACTALAEAQDGVKDSRHPHALRHVVGMREGWEDVLAARREGAASE
jgi:hypothetical protein